MTETGSDAGTGPDEEDAARSADRKGGPGHTVLLAVALAVPVTKVAYTVGGGAAARDVFIGMEPANWPDVLIGMVLTDPLLASVLAVVVSRLVFRPVRGARRRPGGGGVLRALQRAALTVVNPVAMGVVDACFFGPWWGWAPDSRPTRCARASWWSTAPADGGRTDTAPTGGRLPDHTATAATGRRGGCAGWRPWSSGRPWA